MDDVTWGALTLTLTVLGAIWTWLSFRRRGLASGLRALAFTLLPAAAYLTKTLQMFTRIVDAVADWATNLVFNPFVWTGVVLAGVSALLLSVSSVLRARQLARTPDAGSTKRTRGTALPPAGRGQGTPAVGDDDMADIEALLRRRGIS
ncbi:cellulose synthase [Nocardioides sp. KIGAM211]|uniref:Cellulose synthase n=1 Tax=Nocardioides luti TaxID=2761101 RepID=A0A7X0RJF8_9ACTN|nr:cellulose synthase [Nocardioides luti]MBB6629439.1 cellulose synthase [Nocardioides luti]